MYSMPYIDSEKRGHLDPSIESLMASIETLVGDGTPIDGLLNYAISSLMAKTLYDYGLCYNTLNTLVGVLECAKQELYRKVAAPYEDTKIEQNGDLNW